MKILLMTMLLAVSVFLCRNGCFDLRKAPPTALQVKSCISQYRSAEAHTDTYRTVIRAAHDTLAGWIAAGLSATVSMRNDYWAVDSAVFFNKSQDKCLFLVPAISQDSSCPTDICYILAGEKLKNSQWQFYYQSYPDNTYFRSHNKGKPYAAADLVFDTQKSLFEDGLFDPNTCETNSKYIVSDVWFSDWRRAMHKDFLSGKYNIQ